MDHENIKKIIIDLKKSRKNSNCKGSGFAVAAVIESAKGFFYTGVNVEDASWASVCAEKAAVCAMVTAEGPRARIVHVWVMGGPVGRYKGTSSVLPCGSCRQFMHEFSTSRTRIHRVSLNGQVIASLPLKDLLPEALSFAQL